MALPSQEPLSPDCHLGSYRTVRRLGAGGMGVVYEAEHVGLQKRVALKVLHRHLAADRECQARFLREGKAASRIRHPHVVDISHVGEVDGVAFLVMELLEGESLSTRLEREKRLSTEVLCEIVIPVVAALADAHKLEIIHRDLKPENVFLSRSPSARVHPKVLDFGVSKVLDDKARITRTRAFVGTPYYASPEQVAGARKITGGSDQYALGVLLYEASTGINPFAEHESLVGVLRGISEGIFKRPRETYGRIDSALEAIILRAMALAPEDRYASMEALGRELLALADPETRILWRRRFEASESGESLGGSTVSMASARAPSATAPPQAVREIQAEGSTRATLEGRAASGVIRRRRPLWSIGALAVAGFTLLLLIRDSPSATSSDSHAATALEPERPQQSVNSPAAPTAVDPSDPARSTGARVDGATEAQKVARDDDPPLTLEPPHVATLESDEHAAVDPDGFDERAKSTETGLPTGEGATPRSARPSRGRSRPSGSRAPQPQRPRAALGGHGAVAAAQLQPSDPPASHSAPPSDGSAPRPERPSTPVSPPMLHTDNLDPFRRSEAVGSSSGDATQDL